MRIRVATYNLHGLRSGPGRIAAVLRQEEPDIVCIQEAGRSGFAGIDVLRLGRATGMGIVSSRRPASRARNAILFRKDWRVESVGGKDFGRRGRSIVRGVFVARLRKGDARLSVASSHLGLDPDERARHAVELLQGLESLAEPLVLGADLNEQSRAAAAAVKRIAGRYVDVFGRVGEGPGETLPSYQQRIDHLFVSRDVTPVRAWVPSGPDVDRASDHRPVVADLDVPD